VNLEVRVDRGFGDIDDPFVVGMAIKLTGEDQAVDVTAADAETLGRFRRAQPGLGSPGH
jgi:hypothetical protein